jgi:hypothetical protein
MLFFLTALVFGNPGVGMEQDQEAEEFGNETIGFVRYCIHIFRDRGRSCM